MNQRNALLVALNALQAIDDEHPYPIAQHAIVQISKALAKPEQEPVAIVDDWEAVAADQALTIAMLQGDIEHSLARVANALDIADRAYFAGKKDGIDETIALIREKNK